MWSVNSPRGTLQPAKIFARENTWGDRGGTRKASKAERRQEGGGMHEEAQRARPTPSPLNSMKFTESMSSMWEHWTTREGTKVPLTVRTREHARHGMNTGFPKSMSYESHE